MYFQKNSQFDELNVSMCVTVSLFLSLTPSAPGYGVGFLAFITVTLLGQVQ